MKCRAAVIHGVGRTGRSTRSSLTRPAPVRSWCGWPSPELPLRRPFVHRRRGADPRGGGRERSARAGLVPTARRSRGCRCRRRSRAGCDDGAAGGPRGALVHSRVRQLPVCVNGQSYICDIGASLFGGRCPPTERAAGISATKTCWPMANSALRRVCGAVREVRHQDRRRDSFPCRLTGVVRGQHRLGLRDGVGRHRARRHRRRHRGRRCRDERLARSARCRRKLCRRSGSR